MYNNPYPEENPMEALKDALESVKELVGKIFDLQDDYPDLQEKMDDAADDFESVLHSKDREIKGLRMDLFEETRKTERISFYARTLLEFCQDSDVKVPDFINKAFQQLSPGDFKSPLPYYYHMQARKEGDSDGFLPFPDGGQELSM